MDLILKGADDSEIACQSLLNHCNLQAIFKLFAQFQVQIISPVLAIGDSEATLAAHSRPTLTMADVGTLYYVLHRHSSCIFSLYDWVAGSKS
jgi:hypothetical protein